MSTRTTLPRRPSGVSGGELSHAVAPPRDGNSPSTGSRAGARVIGNTSLGIGAGTPAGAPMAPARIAASEIRWTLLMSPSDLICDITAAAGSRLSRLVLEVAG